MLNGPCALSTICKLQIDTDKRPKNMKKKKQSNSQKVVEQCHTAEQHAAPNWHATFRLWVAGSSSIQLKADWQTKAAKCDLIAFICKFRAIYRLSFAISISERCSIYKGTMKIYHFISFVITKECFSSLSISLSLDSSLNFKIFANYN